MEKTPPYSVKVDVLSKEEEQFYIRMQALIKKMKGRVWEISNISELQKEDLTDLAELIKEIERIDAKENILLHFNKCPKCGSNIIETEDSIGGNIEDLCLRQSSIE